MKFYLHCHYYIVQLNINSDIYPEKEFRNKYKNYTYFIHNNKK